MNAINLPHSMGRVMRVKRKKTIIHLLQIIAVIAVAHHISIVVVPILWKVSNAVADLPDWVDWEDL